MPIIKIARARTLDPDVHGIPMCAQTHMLTLPWLHLTKETGDMVMNHPDKVPDSGGGLFVWLTRFAEPDGSPDRHILMLGYTVEFIDGIDVSGLPKDLRDVVLFAAERGFNAVKFEAWDRDSCPPAKGLPIYPNIYGVPPTD